MSNGLSTEGVASPVAPRASQWLAIVAVVALASALRMRALFTDFWLDEIWSFDEFARRARSVGDVFLNPAFRSDNNQHLNTVLLYLIGDRSSWAVYRLPALAAGLMTVAVATMIGQRRSRVEGWTSGLVVAASFLMVVYSTEARGYAFLLLFALLAFQALTRYLDRPSVRDAASFWIWIALGLASHSSISHFYLGALLWSGYRLRGRLRALLQLHTVPIVYAALWIAIVLRGTRVGGGPPWTWQVVGDQCFAWTLGYPTNATPAALTASIVALLVVWDAWHLWREGSDEGLFYIGVIFGPVVLVAALSPPWMFPRYFLISLLFLLLLVARWLARLWHVPHARPAVAAILLLFFAGNLRHIVPFSEYGRGEGAQALRVIAGSSTAPTITVTGLPVDLWTDLPLHFYDRVLGLGGHLRYVRRDDSSASSADWVVVQSQSAQTAPRVSVELRPGSLFEWRASYPAYGPSGMFWSIYQHAPLVSK